MYIDTVRIQDYTTSPEIYSLELRREEGKGNHATWLWINYADGFSLDKWSIQEAVDYWLSDKGKEDRFDSWYRTWCD